MKKISFITTILLLCVSCTVTKQTKSDYNLSKQDSEINKPTNPQTEQITQKGVQESKTENVTVSSTTPMQEKSDYNPYRYEERKIETKQNYANHYQWFLAKECDASDLQTLIEDYNTTKNTQILWTINGNYNCPEVIGFAIDLINTSPDKEVRKVAIWMLNFRKYYDAIPLLLNHIKKEISSDEKIVVASVLATLGKKEEALEILECNCYSIDNMDDNCVYNYFHMFDQSTAIKYFEYYFNKPETQLEAACWLAQLGVYDKTFPFFVEFLKNNDTYERETVYSLVGLAAIGTEEAIEIIKKYAKDDGSLTSDTADRILNRIIKKGSGK